MDGRTAKPSPRRSPLGLRAFASSFVIESRLMIMMNNLDVTPDFMQGLSQMEHEVLEAPLRQ
jgi:hypothetical protein